MRPRTMRGDAPAARRVGSLPRSGRPRGRQATAPDRSRGGPSTGPTLRMGLFERKPPQRERTPEERERDRAERAARRAARAGVPDVGGGAAAAGRDAAASAAPAAGRGAGKDPRLRSDKRRLPPPGTVPPAAASRPRPSPPPEPAAPAPARVGSDRGARRASGPLRARPRCPPSMGTVRPGGPRRRLLLRLGSCCASGAGSCPAAGSGSPVRRSAPASAEAPSSVLGDTPTEDWGAVDAPPKVPLGERLRRKRRRGAAAGRGRVAPAGLPARAARWSLVAVVLGPGVVPALRCSSRSTATASGRVSVVIPRGRDGQPGGRPAGRRGRGLLGVLLQAAREARRARRHQVGHLPAPEGHVLRRRLRRAGRRAAEGQDDRRHDHRGPDDRARSTACLQARRRCAAATRRATRARGSCARSSTARRAACAHARGLPLPRHLRGARRARRPPTS